MRKDVKGYGRALFCTLLFLTYQLCMAQRTDSSAIVSNEDPYQEALPEKLGEHFYDILLPGRKGLQPTVFYHEDDRFFVGLSYTGFSRNWKQDTAGRWQNIYLHYSLNQKAFSLGYKGVIQHFAGGWNLFADAVYDWVNWTNFYGLGNETIHQPANADYYRVRSREAYVGFGLQHRIGRQSSLVITPFYQYVQLIRDEDRYLSSGSPIEKTAGLYNAKSFSGVSTALVLQRLNNLLLPTSGIIFSSGITYTKNISEPKSFATYTATVKGYLPFLNRFVLVIENGATAVTGEPEFYQLASIGGRTLRGYRRERFWGQTVFHNNNELQYLFDSPFRFFKGKMGLTTFADQGRVWLEGEKSDTWHRGYGGGLLVVLKNKLYASAQIGFSKERTGFHFSFRRELSTTNKQSRHLR